VAHTAEVTASTLYEAVAQGLAAITRAGMGGGGGAVHRVGEGSVTDVRWSMR